jgi:GTPase
VEAGPPSGGSGGRGGDVYFLPVPDLTSLSSVPRIIKGTSGGSGQGGWKHGKNGPPRIIRVPLGTVVRQVQERDTGLGTDSEIQGYGLLPGGISPEERRKLNKHRWIHFPGHEETNLDRDSFKEAERVGRKQERERRLSLRRNQQLHPLLLDLSTPLLRPDMTNAPLGLPKSGSFGHLIASGGPGGLGNPSFVSDENRSPKFASRGQEGESMTLALELKILADVALVGFPNAGKSTILRALTGGRAKTEVAGYPFTTLNPVVGVVRVAEDGSYEGGISASVYNDTVIEDEEDRDRLTRGGYAFSPTRNQRSGTEESALRQFDAIEKCRFTVADNPGLVEGSSENVGLGHSFLRAIERSLIIAYVVDLSGSPCQELEALKSELEKYQTGLSRKARVIIANKADLLGGEGEADSIAAAKKKLRELEDYTKKEMIIEDPNGVVNLDLVPVSAKFNQNMRRVVAKLTEHVLEAKRTTASGSSRTLSH